MKDSHNEKLCPTFKCAMDLLAKPWTGLIVAVLAEGPLRFTEISERVAEIGDRMLSERLKELEALGVVERRVIASRPVGVEYELTEAGRAFEDVNVALSRWGEKLLAAQAASARASAGHAKKHAAAAASRNRRG